LRHMKFRDEYIPLILEGVKRSTIRLDRKYRVGETLYVTSVKKGKRYCKIKILDIYRKRLSELTDEDAHMDGFSSREELISALKKIYGDISDDTVLFIYRFKKL